MLAGTRTCLLLGVLLAPAPRQAQVVSTSTVTIENCREPGVVTVSAEDAAGALAFDLRIGFDAQIASVSALPSGDCGVSGGSVQRGELIADCPFCAVAVSEGSIDVSVGCTRPRRAGGSLLSIDFEAVRNGTTALEFQECQINEQTCTSARGGSVHVQCAAETPTETPDQTAAPSATMSPSETITPTPTASATPSPTAPGVPCSGDCDGNGAVTVDEILLAVNVALGAPIEQCRRADVNGDGTVTVDEILGAVARALGGCAAQGLAART